MTTLWIMMILLWLTIYLHFKEPLFIPESVFRGYQPISLIRNRFWVVQTYNKTLNHIIMKSTILTKVNTVTPRNFAHQIEIMNGSGDFEFLTKFCNYLHGKQKESKCIIEFNSNIRVYTSKSAYSYKVYSNHIVRTDLNTTKKKYYAIS